MNQELKKKLIKSSFVTPYTQFDWGDYFSDTDYLDFEEHGIYWNLLKRYYTTGPFENDMKMLQRVTKCPKNKLDGMKLILEEFFFILEEDGCWHHKRCDEEIMRAKGNSEIQSKRARQGAAKKKRNAKGQFISNDDFPSAAGIYPPNKDQEITNKIKQEEINNNDEEGANFQRLRQRLKNIQNNLN